MTLYICSVFFSGNLSVLIFSPTGRSGLFHFDGFRTLPPLQLVQASRVWLAKFTLIERRPESTCPSKGCLEMLCHVRICVPSQLPCRNEFQIPFQRVSQCDGYCPIIPPPHIFMAKPPSDVPKKTSGPKLAPNGDGWQRGAGPHRLPPPSLAYWFRPCHHSFPRYYCPRSFVRCYY